MRFTATFLLLAAGLSTGCGSTDQSTGSELNATIKDAPRYWGCQYYGESKDRRQITNFRVNVLDGDGDGEYQLNVNLYQVANGKLLFDGVDLYDYKRDGVTLFHRGNNLFTSRRGTISFRVTEGVDANGYHEYMGVFSSQKFKIKKFRLPCNWNGQESGEVARP